MPCVVAYDNLLKELLICLLRVNNEKEDYLASLDPNKRHPQLPRVAASPHLIIDPMFKLPLTTKPNEAAIINGFTSSEFAICVHVGEAQLLVIEGDVDTNFPHESFRLCKTCENILSIVTLEEIYSNETDSLPQLCYPPFEGSEEGVKNGRECYSLFTGRLERMRIHLAALDGNGNIQIFRGSYNIFSVDLGSPLFQAFCVCPGEGDVRQMLSSSKPVKISSENNLRINVLLKNGGKVRLSLEVLQRDNLVSAILQAIQSAAPKKLFVCLYSDYLELIQVKIYALI